MSLGWDTGWACVSLLVQGEPRSGKPGTSRETQANPVSQPSDMVLFLSYLKRYVLGYFSRILLIFWVAVTFLH